jgi:hypothetical protein
MTITKITLSAVKVLRTTLINFLLSRGLNAQRVEMVKISPQAAVKSRLSDLFNFTPQMSALVTVCFFQQVKTIQAI